MESYVLVDEKELEKSIEKYGYHSQGKESITIDKDGTPLC